MRKILYVRYNNPAALPVALMPYPKIFPSGLHSLLHPCVAVRNLFRKIKYTPAGGAASDMGQNLWAVLSSKDRGSTMTHMLPDVTRSVS